MQIGRYELKPEKQCLLGIFSTEYGLYWFYEEMTKYTYFTRQWLYVRKFSSNGKKGRFVARFGHLFTARFSRKF